MTKIIKMLDISQANLCVRQYKIEKKNKTDHFFKSQPSNNWHWSRFTYLCDRADEQKYHR